MARRNVPRLRTVSLERVSGGNDETELGEESFDSPAPAPVEQASSDVALGGSDASTGYDHAQQTELNQQVLADYEDLASQDVPQLAAMDSGGGTLDEGSPYVPPVTANHAGEPSPTGMSERPPLLPDLDAPYPANFGFEGQPAMRVAQPGEELVRLGSEHGWFASVPGTSGAEVSVPNSGDHLERSTYRVELPFMIVDGVASNAAGTAYEGHGGGRQIYLPDSMDRLVRDGYVARVGSVPAPGPDMLVARSPISSEPLLAPEATGALRSFGGLMVAGAVLYEGGHLVVPYLRDRVDALEAGGWDRAAGALREGGHIVRDFMEGANVIGAGVSGAMQLGGASPRSSDYTGMTIDSIVRAFPPTGIIYNPLSVPFGIARAAIGKGARDGAGREVPDLFVGPAGELLGP